MVQRKLPPQEPTQFDVALFSEIESYISVCVFIHCQGKYSANQFN